MATGGGPDSKNLAIQDPNSQNPKDKLEGAAAFNQIVASSSLGKTTLPYGTRDYLKELSQNLEGGSGSPAGSEGVEHQDTGAGGDGGVNPELTFDPTKGGQSTQRLYTAREEISKEEAKVFEDKIKELRAAGIVTSGTFPFKATVFKDLDKGQKLTAIGTRGAPDLEYDETSGLGDINGKHLYPCASLIEFLLMINSKIVLKGDFDLARKEMSAAGSGVRINDHSTGRGIDVFDIGKSKTDMINLKPKNLENNKKAFDILLETLAVMDESLHPDLIVFDDRLADDYGILSGAYEIDSAKSSGANGIIQKKYPMLKKIDFFANNGHQDHFHIAFSPQRAGTYIDYVEAGSAPPSAWGNTAPAGITLQQLSKYPDLFASRFNDTSAVKNVDELYQALIGFGEYSPEVAAIFIMIAERESNISAAGFNGNIGTGDYSLGLWQINYYGNQKLITRDIDLYSVQMVGASAVEAMAGEGYKVVKEKVKTYQLLFKDYKNLKINNISSAVKKMEQIYKEEGSKAGKKYADERLFNAATQIGLLKSFVSNYPRRWKFTPWGEYENGPEYGWITKLNFKTAVDIYVKNNPGKTKEDLQKFCAPMIDNMLGAKVHKGKAVYGRWLEGEIFGA